MACLCGAGEHGFYICKELREKQHEEQREQMEEERERGRGEGWELTTWLAKPKRITY